MEQLGAMFKDTRDDEGLQRFIQYLPEVEYNSTSGSFGTLRNYDYYPPATVLNLFNSKRIGAFFVRLKLKQPHCNGKGIR
jgi:hypothetical protein